MTITETEAKTLLRRRKRIDSWFVSRCGMNLYRGCVHDCVYCDGRAEGYYVDGVFGEDVSVKTNAAALLDREIDPRRRRKPFNPGFVMLGGGVGDSYQPIEETYRITRDCLTVLLKHNMPVHVLTKSDLVLRDVDRLETLGRESRAVVSFSLSCTDDDLAAELEPCAALPASRLRAIRKLKERGVPSGVFLMPVVPGITDTEEMLARSLDAVKAVGADFCIFSGMTLKPGRQTAHFMEFIDRRFPSLRPGYEKVFPGNRYGNALSAYYDKLQRRFFKVAAPRGIPLRIPDTLFPDNLDDTDRIIVILEQLDYLHRLRGHPTRFGRAAHRIATANPNTAGGAPLEIPSGLDRASQDVICEISSTGTSALYRRLLAGDL